jgi:tetratricopeptide (TPR) repeat protein
MPRSSTSWCYCVRGGFLALIGALATSIAPAQVPGGGVTRFVDVIELNDHEDQADIVVQFTCSLRYITHTPPTEGTELRIQLQPMPDCGVSPGSQIAGELPPLSGGANIIAAARVDSDVPGQVTLVFNWKRTERYVMAQGVDPRGLRIRLIDRARGRGKIMLNDAPETATRFAVNLESQPKLFDEAAVQLAAQRLGRPAYVSEVTVDGDHWYRLRVGPIDKRADAQGVLQAALADYPRAWLAIGDDEVSTGGESAAEGPLPQVQRIGTDPAADPATLQRMLADARAALAARDYAKAITLLTKLQRQPEFPDRARSQELLGLARERSGQLAHAKAEYEEYLRRYPKGEAAERVALRLRVLRAASMKERHGSGEGGAADRGWRASGGVAQLFRYDSTRVDNSTPPGTTAGVPTSSQTTNQNALYNDVDALVQRRGERYDFMGRVSAGYAKSFLRNGTDLQRVSVATVEMTDRNLGLLARLGRQARNNGGILGTFDGLYVSYQMRPALNLNAAAGYPVVQTNDGLRTDRRFESLALAYAPPGAHWDASLYGLLQQYEGLRDRTAVGVETRLLAPGRSLVGLVDYDTTFHSLNTAALLGSVQLPDRWNLSVDAERRNAPVVSVANALIGQPVRTMAELEQVFLPEQIYQLARDRTALTTNYSITAARPFGQRYQFAATVAATETGATVASGGVDAQPSTGLNLTYQAQVYASNLWRSGDFNVVSLGYSNTEIGKIASLGLTSRFPLRGGRWRLGPRLAMDRRELSTDGSVEWQLLPSALLDFQRGRKLLQFEAGGQVGKRDSSVQSQKTARYYVSLSYRLGF